MGKKSKAFKNNTRQKTNPTPQEIKLLIDAFNRKQYAEMERLAQGMTVNFQNFGLGWKGLGIARQKQHCHTDAVPPLQRAAVLLPNDPEIHNGLSFALTKLLRYTEAEKHCRHALRLTPNTYESNYALSYVLKEQRRYAEAELACRKLLQVAPNVASSYILLASILMPRGKHSEAESSCKQALKIDPKCIEAKLLQGEFLSAKGRIAEAEIAAYEILENDPNNLLARYQLTQLKKVKLEDKNFAELVATEATIQENRTTLMPTATPEFHFALGKCYADTEKYHQAFPHFIAGGKLKRAQMSYNTKQHTAFIDQIIHSFKSATFKRLHRSENSSHLPIFVLGMPRSGTTLTEQIIASHPDVHGAGELTHLMDITDLPLKNRTAVYPENVLELNHAELTAWADAYIKALQQHAPEAQHVTDKMPGNFMMIGLIHLMLPNAKIIHVSRHPIDNCISCFTQLFQNGHTFSYDMIELGHYYANYVRLMEHWREILPKNSFFDVRYEDIVANKETEARRLINYCGLEWNDACLDFHKNKRSIHTASVTQVRQPIYSSSVARWKSYEKFLNPLVDALGTSIQKFESPH